MTRIIAGRWGGRRLTVPPKGTRPTTDRVREAIFSRLDHGDRLRGARVLDLFAGSGALGLEAVSRGAVSATFVESDARAAAVLRANVWDLGGATACSLVKDRVRAFLSRGDEAFDVILLDPPYDIPRAELAAVLEGVAKRIVPGGLVVLEWSSRAGAAPWPPELVEVASKSYGETAVHYAERLDADADGGSVEA